MGKATKHCLCPALGREISNSECGANRQSKYSCPAACPHNPFAQENYTALLSIEDKLDKQTFKWLLKESRDRTRLDRELQSAFGAKSGHGSHAFIAWNLFMRRDERQLTCAQRWAEAGFPDLNNDERVFIQAKMQMRVVLLEVHRILDEQRIEAIDLLAPEAPPMIIVDRSLAARTPRFATLLSWAYPLPHFWRMSGTAIYMPDMSDFESLEMVIETVRHLGGPTEGPALRLWLAEHFVHVDDALIATAQERQRLMITSADAQFGVALYALQAPFAECRAALDSEPEIDRDEPTEKERDEGFAEARDWFDDQASTAAGRKLLGRILLGQAFWRLEATGRARLTTLRKRFEKRLGKNMHFDRERIDDLGTRLAMEMPKADPALVPPRLLEKPMQVELSTSRVIVPTPLASKADIEAHFVRELLRDYADQPLPALNGKTPRQAAGNPSLRKTLLHLLKLQVRRIDEANLRTGRTDDINGLLRELGLAEIDFPPPPRRAPLPQTSDYPEDHPDHAEPDDVGPRQAFNPLPSRPLNENEVSERMGNALADFDTAEKAIAAVAASGATVLDDIDRLTKDLLSDNEYGFLVTFLLYGWFTLAPSGTPAPQLDYEAMELALEHEMKSTPSWVTDNPQKTMDNMTAGSKQSALLQLLVTRMFEGSGSAPKKIRQNPNASSP